MTPQQRWNKAHPERMRDATGRYRKAHPVKAREAVRKNHLRPAAMARGHHLYLRAKYGIGLDVYTEMLTRQNGVCACCGEEQRQKLRGKAIRLHVDHNHATGRVRGLLCHHCNVGLGHFMDNPERLRLAIAYLQETA